MQDLHAFIGSEILHRAVRSPNGRELVIPYPEILDAITIATRHGIAILGVEAFQVQQKAIIPLEYSTYEISFDGAWEGFVAANNEEARAFVGRFVRGEEHGYILTSVSQREFKDLRSTRPTQ